jgi:peptidoglycan/xylan/chitin deacetylase (PgdA/CDA1 family)
MKDVLQLLRKYNAKVTFMIISNYAKQKVHENDMISLLNDGHELANHGIADKSMDKLTKVEFANAINECNQTIYNLQSLANVNVNANAKKEKVKWFRAPQARYTKIMEDVLEENNMHNVMCDCYAACPIIEDGNWIGHSLTKQVLRSSGNGNGSIVLLHMPENGFREYCFTALEILLNELCVKRNYKICTVSELQQIALNENNKCK